MLSSILTVIFAKDMPAHQFEATKDLLKSTTLKHKKGHSSYMQ